VTRVARLTAIGLAVAVTLMVAPEAGARDRPRWIPVDETRWYGVGGDNYVSGFNPTEKRPPFIRGGHLGTDDADGPWLEWVTRISDLPSGVFPLSSIVADDGLLFVSGASTNSFMALNQKTGLPVWRFQPDPRADGYTSAYPASNAPTVHDGIVYATFSNGYLYALDAKTGRKIWSYRATDGYADTNRARLRRLYTEDSQLENRGDNQPVHQAVTYTKIHGATGFCDGKVFFTTLAGWAYGLNAKTGKLLWKRYADGPEFPGELVWPEFKVGGVQRDTSKAAGYGTRRFEAVPGLACGTEVIVYGADGHIRFLDPDTGKDKGQGGDAGPEFTHRTPDGTDFCAAAGWQCDMAVGTSDPISGDYFITTLDARVARMDWRTHTLEWDRQYDAALPFEAPGGIMLVQPHREYGFITQAVTGGLPAVDPFKRMLYFSNQDGHLYVLGIPREGERQTAQTTSCPPGYTSIRVENATPATAEPCLIARVGISVNNEETTPYTRRGVGGPWDYDQAALTSNVLGGDVLYVATWDHKMHAFDVRNPRVPRKVWEYEVKWDPAFRFPPFGDSYPRPFADIDLNIWSGPALLGGHLYFAANDGSVYSFNLRHRVATKRNLVILGSGNVPFLPELKEALGAFDRVWTPADWYKNQVPPPGYRFPKPAGAATASTLLLSAAGLWWWVRRRDLEEVG
jgi:outer membrane protein assembly factor BamB